MGNRQFDTLIYVTLVNGVYSTILSLKIVGDNLCTVSQFDRKFNYKRTSRYITLTMNDSIKNNNQIEISKCVEWAQLRGDGFFGSA